MNRLHWLNGIEVFLWLKYLTLNSEFLNAVHYNVETKIDRKLQMQPRRLYFCTKPTFTSLIDYNTLGRFAQLVYALHLLSDINCYFFHSRQTRHHLLHVLFYLVFLIVVRNSAINTLFSHTIKKQTNFDNFLKIAQGCCRDLQFKPIKQPRKTSLWLLAKNVLLLLT